MNSISSMSDLHLSVVPPLPAQPAPVDLTLSTVKIHAIASSSSITPPGDLSSAGRVIPVPSPISASSSSREVDQETFALNIIDGIFSAEPIKDGEYIYCNGAVYRGPLKNGLPNGKGKLTFRNGQIYEGQFKDAGLLINSPNSNIGRLTVAAGEFYEFHEGQLRIEDGKFSGRGIHTILHRFIYEGEFQAGLYHGHGKHSRYDGIACYYKGINYRDIGTVYEGEFQNGKRHGKGKITYYLERSYEGGFENDEYHGYGKYTFPNGEIFEGLFKNMRFNGEGTFTDSSNGNIYKGIFIDGKLPTGELTYRDGRIYKGSLKGPLDDNKPHGQGELTHNGDVYKGVFIDGELPAGELTYRDGRVYKGQFRGGKPHGQGKLTYPDRSVEEGEFRNGQFIPPCCCIVQ